MRENISDLKSQISKNPLNYNPFFLTILLGLVITLILVSGCYDPPPPESVFVPGPNASTEITIAVSDNRVNVNEPVILYASRRTSGFVEIP